AYVQLNRQDLAWAPLVTAPPPCLRPRAGGRLDPAPASAWSWRRRLAARVLLRSCGRYTGRRASMDGRRDYESFTRSWLPADMNPGGRAARLWLGRADH